MSGDLSARLDAALRRQEQHEADTRADAATLADLHARVARVRRGRGVSYAAVAAVLVGVLGVAGWFGLRADPVPLPAHTPTPSPTASATPAVTTPAAPSPEPEPTPTSTPVAVAGMPPLLSLPEGALDTAGPGWSLVTYAPLVYDGPERTVLVLSAPTGELYFLRDDDRRIDVVRWDGGRTARASTWQQGRGTIAGDFDLLTGELVEDSRVPAASQRVALLPGGDELWLTESHVLRLVPRTGEPRRVTTTTVGSEVLVSPDGARAVVEPSGSATPAVLDLATGAQTPLSIPDGRSCWTVGWLDATSVLATCRDDYELTSSRVFLDQVNARVVRFDALTGRSQTVRNVGPSDDLVPAPRGRWLGDGTLVVERAPLTRAYDDCFDVCWSGAYLWSGDTMTPVPTATALPDETCEAWPGGDGLFVRTGESGCYEPAGSSTQLWTVDPSTGAVRSVGPTLGEAGALGAYRVVEPGVTSRE